MSELHSVEASTPSKEGPRGAFLGGQEQGRNHQQSPARPRLQLQAYRQEYVGHAPVPGIRCLLQPPKPAEFCAPHCLGYFDDRDDAENSDHDYRFGIVYEKLEKFAPVSLPEMMTKYPQAAMKNRIILAHKFSVCILYLHAVDWLHKSLRSDSIVFFPPFKGLAEPYLTDDVYARADRPGETIAGGDVDEWTPLGTKGTYRKTVDFYSLGTILLEIAYWMPVEKIMAIDMEAADVWWRAHLVRRDSKVMRTLSENLGRSYYDVVRACLQGREAFGIGLGESEVDVGVGAKLQKGVRGEGDW
ncbi:MAG: hypothetical protein LQ350_008217 [Teloschistes chrysophthalmus]|nr:MAG: hypothetical protein LQ350_008217 [Niorma chrysophthalma]